MANAPVVSVFSSIQGEGLYVGRPHLFIRLAGCNLRCSYCDTPEGLVIPKHCRIETAPFGKISHTCRNPMENGYLLHTIKRLTALFPHYHAIALTGGEPLLHAAFLKVFLRYLRRLKIPILLETNGTLPEQLKQVIDLIDIISMDIKMPSDAKSNNKLWESTKRFLTLADSKKTETYIKIIMNHTTPLAEYQKALRIIAGINKHIPVVLQPVSAVRWGVKTPVLNRIIRIHNIFTKELSDVRIIPQMHQIMGWK
ncbi:MAG: 7-carboxy-7-deazaguanine synthase QueE [Planctomycetes bacterium]|nr:7-carboxy-7-deazaguanine synthase QueE [Planctomycetota bacterium]